jgi:hypothetical protein
MRDIIKELISDSGGRLQRGKGKNGLIKNNMARNENAMSGEVHA